MAAFLHPTDYNPFSLAREQVNLDVPDGKEHRRVPVKELREMMASVRNIRARALIYLGFNCGLRADEVANTKLRGLSLHHAEIRAHYPEMGAEPRLKDHPDALYVPGRHEYTDPIGRLIEIALLRYPVQ